MPNRRFILPLVVLATALVCLTPLGARAQGVGEIKLYSDIHGTSCNITGNPTVFTTVYVFHVFHTGVTASQFMIEDNGTNFLYLAQSPQNGTTPIGEANAGASYAYEGGCVTTYFNFLNVFYNGLGTAGLCSSLEVVPDPNALSGTIEATDCSLPFPLRCTADGSILTVNCPDEFRCGDFLHRVEPTPGGDAPLDCIPVPVEPTTWGAVKALYK